MFRQHTSWKPPEQGRNSGVEYHQMHATVRLRYILAASVVIAVLVILPRFVPLPLNGDVKAILLWNLALGVFWCALLVFFCIAGAE
jgi:uncharacterized membrane protein YGL010W